MPRKPPSLDGVECDALLHSTPRANKTSGASSAATGNRLGYVSYANSQFGPNGPRDFEKANGSRDLGHELSSNSTQGKIQNGPFLI